MKVAIKQNKVMYKSTPIFTLLGICNYIRPGTSYEKWVKTFGPKLSKSWL